MKKFIKVFATILIFFAAIPLLAGLATSALWNHLLVDACGFAMINLWHGVGVFILGQIVSGGFILGCFFAMGSLHRALGHPRGSFSHHWHSMTDEERREFIERRATFGCRHKHQDNGDAAE